MNVKRWLLASLAVLVVFVALEMLIHNVLLRDIYMQTASVWRPMEEMDKLMHFIFIGYLVFAPLFTLIYAKGYEKGKSGLAQGLRFGLYFGGALSVMGSFGWYPILPIPLTLAVSWFASILVTYVAAGAAAGAVYRS
jgi:hypothetical protein